MDNYSINEIIEFAIQVERCGYSFYNKALERKDLSEKIYDILKMLRDDEKEHEKKFESLRSDIDNKTVDDSIDWFTVSQYLKSIIDSHIFFDSNNAINLALNAKNSLEILEKAIVFEKDTLLFFLTLDKYLNIKGDKNIINKIAEEEKIHIIKLTDILKTLEN